MWLLQAKTHFAHCVPISLGWLFTLLQWLRCFQDLIASTLWACLSQCCFCLLLGVDMLRGHQVTRALLNRFASFHFNVY